MPIKNLPDVRVVVFDVGETLVDESRAWALQAREIGVAPFTLMGVIGALIADDRDHREVWNILGVQPPATAPPLDAVDLYPDALACLRCARTRGLIVGIAGNQPAGVEARLAAAGFEADFIASSALWGVSKPSPGFFSRITQASGARPDQILYVGDRLDNDVLPARSAGMRTAFLRRGPWGFVQARRPQAALADLRLDSLLSLEELIATPTDQT